MFDFAWSEILLIGVVALIAIGPKDMPAAIRTVSRAVKKARRMAAEFQTHVDEMVREADLGDVRKTFSEIRNFDIPGALEKHIDPDRRCARPSTRTRSSRPIRCRPRFRLWTRSRWPPRPCRKPCRRPPRRKIRRSPTRRRSSRRAWSRRRRTSRRRQPPPTRRLSFPPGPSAPDQSERLTWQDRKTTI